MAASDGACALLFGTVPTMTCDFTSGLCMYFGESITFVSLIGHIPIEHLCCARLCSRHWG